MCLIKYTRFSKQDPISTAGPKMCYVSCMRVVQMEPVVQLGHMTHLQLTTSNGAEYVC